MSIENKSTAEIDQLLKGKTQDELAEIYDKALGLLPSRAPIYLPTEKIPLPDKIKGVEHVRKIYREDLDAVYRPRMRALREQFKGRKRCFLIGNGPSLNRTDLAMLKDEVTFAVNGFFLKAEDLDWVPTFYCVEDHLVAEDRAEWINDFKGPIKFFPAYLGYMFPPSDDTIFYNHRPRVSYPHGFDFSMEADKITYTGCTVTFSLMQLATYLGFEEIYLIGVDASYDIPADTTEGTDYAVGVLDMKSDDPNHFNPDYFGKGFRWHDPQVGKMVEAYGEARKTLEGTGQTIYNATVGGKLEVFERRAFNDIFPQARDPEIVARDSLASQEAKKLTAAMAGPARMLVIDMTAMGNSSATGAIKASLFQDWPDDRLLQIGSPSEGKLTLVRRQADKGYSETQAAIAEIHAAIDDFDPEVILYRPLADRPKLHEFAMSLIGKSKLPLVTWIMDDWPARLQASDPELFTRLDRDLRQLLNRSALNLSICDAMSDAFEARYGVAFKAYANGIDPDLWPARAGYKAGPVVVRYAGGLAPDMNAASVLRVARAVEDLAETGLDIRLEINTQPWWIKQSGALFDGLTATNLTSETRPFKEYVQWLQAADILLVAYNFDEKSLRYVRYSMANKLPECLASGAALFVHGPHEVATVDYVARNAVGQVAAGEDLDEVKDALRALCAPARRQELAGKARDLVLARHSLPELASDLAADIAGLPERQPSGAFASFLFGKDHGISDTPVDPEDLAARLDPGLSGLITYDDPAAVLARVLGEKGDLAVALAAWEMQAAASLAVFRRNRRQVSIVERSRMAAAPAAYRTLLGDLLAGQPLPVVLRRPMTMPDPLRLTIAQIYVEQSPAAQRHLAELRACGRRPDGVAAQETPALSDVLVAYQALAGDQEAAPDQVRDLAAAQARVADLEKELDDQRAQAQQATTDLTTARTRVAGLEKERVDLRALGKKAITDLTMARTRVSGLEDELGDLRTQGKRATTDLAAARARIAGLEKERDDLRTQGERAATDLTAARAHIFGLEEELGDLRAQGERVTTDLAAARARISGLETELGDQRAQGERAANDLTAARTRISDLEKELGDLQIRERNLTLEAKLHDEQSAQLQATVEAYFTGIATLRKTLAERDQALATAQAEIDRLHVELDQVYRSKSWRVTQPLRGIRRVVGPDQTSGSRS